MPVMQSDDGTTGVHTKGPQAFAVTEILGHRELQISATVKGLDCQGSFAR